MAKSELFAALDAAFRHQPLEHPPSMYVFNRFLASIKEFAPHARWMSLHVRDDALAYEVWRTALPLQRSGAPYLSYPAPRSQGAPGELVEAVMARYFMSREAAEDTLSLLQLAGREEELARYLGVELDDDEE